MTYPNVPNLPGVPALNRNPLAAAQSSIVLLGADALSIYNLFQTPQWGLFTLGNQPAFASSGNFDVLGFNVSGIAGSALQLLGAGGQSVGEFEYRQENRISSAPQEQGAFLSYNKVASPFSGRVAYIVGGLEAQRAAFIAAVDQKVSGLELLNLVMPEKTYLNVNVTHYDFRRTARSGISMFVVDIWVEEVRITAPAAFSNTKLPSSASNVNVGTVAPVTSTPLPPPT